MFRSVLVAGHNALKSAILINGGACVALLAFLGHIWDKTLPEVVAKGLTDALLLFVGGVFLCVLATGTTYLTQAFYAVNWSKTGATINVISILLGLGSVTLFACGGYRAYTALVAQFE